MSKYASIRMLCLIGRYQLWCKMIKYQPLLIPTIFYNYEIDSVPLYSPSSILLQVVWLKIRWATYEVEYCIFENNNHIALRFIGLVKGHLTDIKQVFSMIVV